MKKSLFLLLILIGSRLSAQNPSGSSGQYPPPVKVTAEHDHQNMMSGIANLSSPAQPNQGQANANADPPSTQQLLTAGWGYAMIDPSSIQADNGAGLTKGIIGLVNKGQPHKPDDWGSLRAWAWGAAESTSGAGNADQIHD